MKLVIFDLDHTLVDVFWLHDQTTNRIFKKYFNKDAWLHEIDHAGRSQPDGLLALALSKGISEKTFRNKLPELLADFYAEFVASLPDDAYSYILPGVTQLLDRLSGTENIIVLYTGDSPTVGRGILKATGLERYFSECYFGTEFTCRSDMVRAAVNTASAQAGYNFKGKDIVVIGDSLRDIQAGQTFGALTIAVATGQHTLGQLAEGSPDLLIENLADADSILDTIDI